MSFQFGFPVGWYDYYSLIVEAGASLIVSNARIDAVDPQYPFILDVSGKQSQFILCHQYQAFCETPHPTLVPTLVPTRTPLGNPGDVNNDATEDIVDALLVAQ